MFGRDNDNGNAPENPQNTQQQPATLPPMSTFHVTRMNPERYNASGDEQEPIPQLERVTLQAHKVQMNEPGNVLRFIEARLDIDGTVSSRIVRTFNGWIDYEEEWPAPPSLILTPGLVM